MFNRIINMMNFVMMKTILNIAIGMEVIVAEKMLIQVIAMNVCVWIQMPDTIHMMKKNIHATQ